ncbi:Rieske 2Fe-2S domain-containing protein [Parahaliea maris]|uniref:Rieske 2Fe-2S domain-containing protein n=1 Tax=Parahaliea maris TaxID=2716870 RepID=A0A5C8ZUQ4_9GAMM|nr:Rieske 2Fe-2S domain-containing protein [Parahaliea maris]
MRLCQVEELAEGEARGFDPLDEGQDSVFVVRRGGDLVAYRDICPHYGSTALPWRKDAYLDAGGKDIICSAHGARFAIDTGLCTAGPCLGESLIPVPLQLSDEGEVLADLNSNNSVGVVK